MNKTSELYDTSSMIDNYFNETSILSIIDMLMGLTLEAHLSTVALNSI